ncbi:peroxidase [Thozetella sp. PMI_491]|nr:peroxidase [Thozetella sp. PMI_491]
MGKTLAALKARGSSDSLDSTELIGDLNTGTLSKVGQDVASIITGRKSGESDESWDVSRLPKKGTPQCSKDTCCIWQYVSNDMKAAFTGKSGRCTDLARGAVRLGFHDAAGWSKATGPGGGADGSIILAAEEMTRSDNLGLQETVDQFKIWYNQYKSYGVGMADLIQMGANVATVVCPLGPRIKSYVGRKDSSTPCPKGLLPGVNQDANTLIQLFQNKTIQPHGLTALIGAHTTSQQRFVDPQRAGDPQDSTPGVWDVAFYKETLGSAPARVFRFASDIVLAKDSRIASEFREFAGPGGQQHWNEDYAREYVRLSLLGVFNINDLTDCTKVLPARTSGFNAPDQTAMDKWLGSTLRLDTIANSLRGGESIASFLDFITKSIGGLLGKIGKFFSGW